MLIKRLRTQAGESFRLGDYGTHELLLDLLESAENRAHHLDHFLQKNGLSLEAR